jgi:hypothetical protein
LYSAELYRVPDDYQSDFDVDYTDTLESKRRQVVRPVAPFLPRDLNSTHDIRSLPQLLSQDPVHAVKLSSFIGEKLAEAQALNGGATAFQAAYLSRVDPLVLEELVQRLDGRLAG